VTQLYPQVPGSLSIAFYDWQGNGGGIPTRLHTGIIIPYFCFLVGIPMGPISKDFLTKIMYAFLSQSWQRNIIYFTTPDNTGLLIFI
jgi:hypothetical protein